MSDWQVFLQQLINGFSNGMIIALIALGYTLVYGIVELINFAHGDLVMLGSFLALTLVELLDLQNIPFGAPFIGRLALLLVLTIVFCGMVNWAVDRIAYRPIRRAPRLSQLVTAIGVSFIFLNIGLFWGGMPLSVFNMGAAAAAPKAFPSLVANSSILSGGVVEVSYKDVMVAGITIPLMFLLTYVIRSTRWGMAMRAVAQNPTAAQLMGINMDQVIGRTFFLGGALGGVASVVYSLYNNTIYFQMGYRIGMDGFTAAVLGGIGNLPGAVLGGLMIGIIRAFSDQYLATMWTNVMVFLILILVLVFRPTGLLGARVREKV